MLLLALSTSGPAASAALLRDGVLLDEIICNEGLTHSETIMPITAELLERNALAPKDIDIFAADVGPGSFTGVRIGVCAANAMAAAKGAAVVEVSSLTALYEGLGDVVTPVCALLDARNGNGYAALFDAGKCLMEPAAVTVAELLPALPKNTLFVGDGEAFRAEIERVVAGAVFAPQSKNLLRAGPAAAAAWKRWQAGERVKEARPLYLRPTQAERLYKAKEQTK